ncbi:MAG: hypothetical protein IKA64_02670 [Clostridia bacterium]|nr:hypothetical protein [Clostridia bacterium]
MLQSTRGLYSRSILYFSLASIAVYAVYHLAFTFMLSEAGDVLYYLYTFLHRAFELAVPATAVAISLALYSAKGIRSAFSFLAVPAATRLLYSLPYYYIGYISEGFDTSESIPLSLLTSAAEVAVFYLILLGIFGFALLFTGRSAKGRRRELIAGSIGEVSASAPSPASRAILGGCLGALILLLAFEIIDTVTLLIECSFRLMTGEIIYIAACYALLALVFLILYYSSIALVKRLYG